jgi:hypothetical protein
VANRNLFNKSDRIAVGINNFANHVIITTLDKFELLLQGFNPNTDIDY